ncbi:MAG: sugar transferase [Mogibacterium sp.]|nr:sugar transferase [Mogibacterium sp.]
MKHIPKAPYEKYIKRPLDFVLATAAFAALSPVLGATALAVKKKLGSPVLFFQERPGRIDSRTGEEKIFKLYKFRTMTDERGEDGELLPDEERMTKFGRFLRSTSLDELPELLNIIKGDMAIVGPRPLLVRYLPRYSAHQRRRHEVRPGLTGLAQVHGRNAVSWEDKFDWDVKYADNVSFIGDLRIVLGTVKTVLAREGISSETSATMEEFMGSGEEPKN